MGSSSLRFQIQGLDQGSEIRAEADPRIGLDPEDRGIISAVAIALCDTLVCLKFHF